MFQSLIDKASTERMAKVEKTLFGFQSLISREILGNEMMNDEL
jgi:hypothetical protein